MWSDIAKQVNQSERVERNTTEHDLDLSSMMAAFIGVWKLVDTENDRKAGIMEGSVEFVSLGRRD